MLDPHFWGFEEDQAPAVYSLLEIEPQGNVPPILQFNQCSNIYLII